MIGSMMIGSGGGGWDVQVESIAPDTSPDALPGTFALRIRARMIGRDDQVIDITGARFTGLQVDRRDIDIPAGMRGRGAPVMAGRLDFDVGGYTVMVATGSDKGDTDG